MEQKTFDNYKRWLDSSSVSDEDKAILKGMNDNEIDDAFFKNIEFGTGGMRGVLGPGTNRMNIHVVKRATIGFGLYLLEKYPNAKAMGVAISHDNRHMSREFTLLCVDILNKMGINTYIFDSLRPTPELSFAVRYKKCCGGIMITASHNPKEYNGYKVYDETGCQLVPDLANRLIELINSLPNELDVKVEGADKKGTNVIFDHKIDDDYVELVKKVQLNPDLDKSNFKIVYTPNHGTSYVNAMRVFKDCGYDVTPVLSQCNPDPNFGGTLSPNPEEAKAFIEPIKLAKEINADLITMTDPDGDRVGLACKLENGEYRLLTGNESAAILIDYILSQRQKQGTLSKNGVIYNTVVTSALGAKVAKNYGVGCESFLTGFKYIGERIHHYEKLGKGPTFEFGYEESYGCLIAPFVRDKDGIQAILMYSEMALYYHNQGKNLAQVYDELGEKYGHHQAKLFNIYFKGSEGAQSMARIMHELEVNPFTSLCGNEVEIIENYFKLEGKNIKTGEKCHIDNIPTGDLIKFIFKDGTNICVRPSGTEPKCKFYVEVIGKTKDELVGKNDEYYQEILKLYNIKA